MSKHVHGRRMRGWRTMHAMDQYPHAACDPMNAADGRGVHQLILQGGQGGSSVMSCSCVQAVEDALSTPSSQEEKSVAPPLTGTFFCVTKHTESAPRTAMLVKPLLFTALNAYSASWQAGRERWK